MTMYEFKYNKAEATSQAMILLYDCQLTKNINIYNKQKNK